MPQQRKNSGGDGSRDQGLSGREAIERVRDELPELLGRPIEAVLGLERGEGKGWNVTVSIVELSRIPHSTDVLGAYSVTLDSDGELAGWQRRRTYHRNQADEG